ncbi:glycosyl transferase family 90 [Arthrobacter sp. AET 35A]|uniref:glycosyl transferase family 90 n=1 Tax=Arthrobacter sp. AET 35A TaxID=2292643 RepID=UPI00177D1AD4|nr:glycosyl transferase family 90 [Arthrobacter sp. AET 35A]
MTDSKKGDALLHQYMLPELTEAHQSLELENCRLPSDLFVGFDGRSGQVFVGGASRTEVIPLTGDMFENGYKPARNRHFFNSLPSDLSGIVLADMEDARAFDSEIYLDAPRNIFQYNRRRGNRTAVLWRLQNYFEPSSAMGHPSGSVQPDEISFECKKPRVFWRGGLTGSRWTSPYVREGIAAVLTADRFENARTDYSRINAVMLARNNESLDLKFFISDGSVYPWMAISDFVESRVTSRDFLEYKYVLCPNGNDVSSNLYWLISTNSIAFKEECDYEVLPDYFLKPWIHYVPVARGLSDLEEKFDFCEQNPDLCRRIIENANSAYAEMTDQAMWGSAESTVLERLSLI